MEFEKVSRNEIRCIIDESDLEEWNLTLDDLFSNGEKARGFIEDIVKQAQEEYDFVVDSVPLAVQISSLGDDRFSFIISKLSGHEGMEPDAGLFGKILREALAKTLGQEIMKNDRKQEIKKEERKEDKRKEKKKLSNVFVLPFEKYDQLIAFCKRLGHVKGVASRLYQDRTESVYYLLMKMKNISKNEFDYIFWLAGEYTQKNKKKHLTSEYISEHYKVLLEKDAVDFLRDN